MKTLLQVVQLSCDYVRSKGSFAQKREVEELIASTLGVKRLDLYLNHDKPLVENELAKIREKIARLAANEPLQYIEGEVLFLDCKIKVDKRALIPRPETEELAQLVVKAIEAQKHEAKTLWDICTGSGCLGIAIKKHLPALNVVLSDISLEALQLAQENGAKNGVSIACYQGDLLEPFAGSKADFVVVNPPYVAEYEYHLLDPRVRDFEPKGALVSGPTGLECYERLAQQLKKYVNLGGMVWFEVGINQAGPVKSLLSGYEKVTIIKDFAGIERFLQFQIPS